jgi:hypothetical protein
MLPESVVVVVFAGLALAFTLVFAPKSAPRRQLLVRGGAGLTGTIAIAAVPTFDLALLVLLALGVLNAAVASARPFAARLRAPLFAVGLLAMAGVLARVEGPDVLQRLAAVGMVAGLGAGIGLLPYLHPLDPDEAVTSSPIAWLAFIGPVLAAALVVRMQDQLNPDAAGAFGAALIGVGLVNIACGGLGAWRTENTVAAWRYSFSADWGLALCGMGLTVADGRRGAFLVLFTIVLCRLPLYLASRQALREKAVTERPINLVVAAALAGSAPFAGFAARILLLRGATELYWPLALALALGMLLWLPGSFRLGLSLGFPRGRQALGVAIVLAINVAVGLYPLPILGAARL